MCKKKTTALPVVPAEIIERRILLIRGHKVPPKPPKELIGFLAGKN